MSTSKLKVCTCTPDGTIIFYQNSKGQQVKSPAPYVSHQNSNSYRGYSPQNNLENNRYTYQQIHLYEKCVYGLQVCTPQEIAKMSLREKARLIHNHKRTQQLINLSKWKATSNVIKDVFHKVFPQMSTSTRNTLNVFLNSTNNILDEDDLVLNRAPMKLIGGRESLISKMIENKILPANFYNLKTA